MALHVLAYNLTLRDEYHGQPAADGGDPGLAKSPRTSSSRQPTSPGPSAPSVLTRPRPISDIIGLAATHAESREIWEDLALVNSIPCILFEKPQEDFSRRRKNAAIDLSQSQAVRTGARLHRR